MRQETGRITEGVPAEVLQRKQAGKWTALEILEHLLLSYTATTKGLLRAMEVGRPEQGRRHFGQKLKGFYLLGLGRFPAGIDAPKQVVPRGSIEGEPLRRFNDALVAMDASLRDAERRFGKRTRILSHPVLGPLTAQQWRRFHEVHGKHHLRQMAARLNSR